MPAVFDLTLLGIFLLCCTELLRNGKKSDTGMLR
jgi:hypothetical protein